MIGVRDNQDMAAASTVSPERMKLIAFSLAGGMAAFAGCLFITLRVQVSPVTTFTPDDSLRLVATAIIGGLGSVAGPVLGALFVRGLPALFNDVAEVRLLTSGIGLLLLLMYFPGGLMQIVYALRDAVLGWADSRMEPEPVATVPPSAKKVPARSTRELTVPHGQPWLSLRGVSVRFGGIRAVNDVNFDVGEGRAGRPDRHQRRRQVHADERHQRLRPVETGRIEVLGTDVSGPSRPTCGTASGSVGGSRRRAVSGPDGARDGDGRARGPGALEASSRR
jgi:hypothetical protein